MNKTAYRIPFNRPPVVGGEMEAMAAALASGHLSGDGSYTRRCHALLEQETGCARALLTTSCTHALEMAALLLAIKPGDEVIVPSYTFVSTVNAFVLRGATPVFADVREDTLNLDERRLPELLTRHTRCIVPVHYAGVACAMPEIMSIAAARGIPVVEDNAHGLYGRYHGRPLGSWGDLATQSFHETKNFTCGEGGALLINNPALVQRAEIIREKGTNRSRFFRGEVDKYSWVDVGSSYLPSEILAAYLAVQLEYHDRIQERRKVLWNRYHATLSGWAIKHGVRLPVVPEGVDQAYHMYYLLLPDEPARARVIAHLKARGILAVFHYLPLHLSDMGRQYGGKEGDCPVTERISEQILRLPLYYALTDAEQDEVIAALLDAPL
jgi:dTDP-4-amino-4,6-dideoxygalactose transaminase